MHRGRWVVALGASMILSACSGVSRPVAPTSTTGTSGPPPVTTPTTGTPAGGGSWTTYGRDLARTGSSPAKANLSSVRRTWVSTKLDGRIYAQPLIWDGLVIVATEDDTLYGLHARTGRVAWSTNVGAPVPRSALPCGNIDPLGITSTPAIDPKTGRLFALAETYSNGTVAHRLVALDARDGKLLFDESADPAEMTPTDQQQRPALGISRGRVYIAYGGLAGDCASYKGWVVALPTSAPGPMLSYAVPTVNQGAIWAPGGPSIDSTGDVWVATGNGSSTTSYDGGDSVIELSSTLRELQSFAPSQWAVDNGNDLDLGSTAPQLLEGGLVFQVGKESTGYLLRTSHLGGIGGQAYAGDVCPVIGANAYRPPDIYIPCPGGLEELVVTSGSSPSFRVAWTAEASVNGPPIIAGGYVWSVGRIADELYGLDPATGRILQAVPLDAPVDHFATPSEGEGLLLVGTGDTVSAFSGS